MKLAKPFAAFALFLSLLTTFAAESARAAEPAIHAKAKANGMTEVSFTSSADHKDPFNEITLDAIFTEPGGKERRVPAFWAGGKTWKVRYSSPVAGEHPFRTECSSINDAGLHGVTGMITVDPYVGDHPLYKHGPLRIAQSKRYIEHADGTPFLWLGDTWWMGLSKRLAFPHEFNTLLADRLKKGFNVVQVVAGLYPDMPAFDERGFNEAGHPWEKDYARIRPAYFDEADKRIMRLVEAGITPCVVGAWGYHLPWLGEAKMNQHQRYLYARWGALPIIWCVGGETNLPYYLDPGFPTKGGDVLAKRWSEVIRYCRSINAFDRLITTHPTGIAPMSARGVIPGANELLDFDMLQTAHGQLDVIPQTVAAPRYSYALEPPMPVVNGEPSYEMLLDKTPAEIARMCFWVSWGSGVTGYTYGANGIWQLNGKDKPYGNSPWGGSYGKISWQDAMNLAGSTHVGIGTKFLAQYPWHKFEPKPMWAEWAKESGFIDVKPGDWIWFPEGEPAKDAPVAARYFRKTFDLPAGAKVKRASLRITADDRSTVWLNGKQLGAHATWNTFREFNVSPDQLRAGRNVIAVKAENLASNVTQNPAGMSAGMGIELDGGQKIELRTDASWRAGKDEVANWQNTDFDDTAWPVAKVAAAFGAGPWGNVGTDAPHDAYIVPYTMGIPRELRIVYVPRPGAVTVNELEPGVKYHATHFDPVTGEKTPLGEVTRDASGAWRCEAPSTTTHDWVLVLETVR